MSAGQRLKSDAGRDDPDRVEIPVVQHLDAHDRAVLRLDELLDERGAVGAEVERGGARLPSSARESNRSMSAPEPPTFGLTRSGKRSSPLAFSDLVAVVDDDRPRIAHTQALEETDLQRLGLLEAIRAERD